MTSELHACRKLARRGLQHPAEQESDGSRHRRRESRQFPSSAGERPPTLTLPGGTTGGKQKPLADIYKKNRRSSPAPGGGGFVSAAPANLTNAHARPLMSGREYASTPGDYAPQGERRKAAKGLHRSSNSLGVGWIRTNGLGLMRPPLCLLSYAPVFLSGPYGDRTRDLRRDKPTLCPI